MTAPKLTSGARPRSKVFELAAVAFFVMKGVAAALFWVPIPRQRAVKCHTGDRPFCDISPKKSGIIWNVFIFSLSLCRWLLLIMMHWSSVIYELCYHIYDKAHLPVIPTG